MAGCSHPQQPQKLGKAQIHGKTALPWAQVFSHCSVDVSVSVPIAGGMALAAGWFLCQQGHVPAQPGHSMARGSEGTFLQHPALDSAQTA